ncbi:hypothetical protein ACVXZ4_10945 [Lacisediminihabitans sp. FW035]
MFGKTNLDLVRAALDKYLPTIPTEKARFPAPLGTQGIRVHIGPAHVVDIAEQGGWWVASTNGAAFENTPSRANSGLQAVTAVIAATVVRHFQPHLFPTSTDRPGDDIYDTEDDVIIQGRVIEAYEFLVALANAEIRSSDDADELARRLLVPLAESIDRHNVERTRAAQASDERVASSAAAELQADLNYFIPSTPMSICPQSNSRDGYALEVEVRGRTLKYFPNNQGVWSECTYDDDPYDVELDDGEELTPRTLVKSVLWAVMSEYTSPLEGQDSNPEHPDQAMLEGINSIRKTLLDGVPVGPMPELLSQIGETLPAKWRRDSGFDGPTRQTAEVVEKVAVVVRDRLSVEDVVPRLETDGSYTFFVVYEGNFGFWYVVSPDGVWTDDSGHMVRIGEGDDSVESVLAEIASRLKSEMAR